MLKIRRKRCVELQIFPGFRVKKADYFRMERLAHAGYRRLPAGSIYFIPENRMADISHVYPDLVGSAGFQPAGNIGEFLKSF